MNVWLILARFSAGNHPFGFRFCPRAQLSIRHTSPSKADLQITKRVAAAPQDSTNQFPGSLRHIKPFVQSSQSSGTQLLVMSVQKRFEFFARTARG